MTMSCKNQKAVPLFIARSHLTTEANKTGAWRFLRPRYDEKTAPCAVACPAGEDIGRIQMLASQGLFKEAWETVLIENPFPGVCGRICRHPCETVCNRGRFDEAVAVHTIERFLADTASRYELKPHFDRLPPKKERIAVAGAGSSGLAAAWFLALMGYGCDVYEIGPEPGGVLRWGVPSYRLPQGVLREEIARIVEPGVRIHCGNTVGEEFFARTASTYDAVFVACGAWEPGPASRSVEIPAGGPAALTVPGEDLPGIEDGLELLRKVAAGNAPALEGPVAVIGGGYAAIEVARCVVRLGAKAVFVYTRGREDMPASRQGIAMALEEGVEVLDRMTPVSIEAQGGEFLITLREDRAPAAQPKTLQAQPKAAPIPAAGPAALRVIRIFMAGGAWEPGPASRSVEIIRTFGGGRSDAAEQWMLPPEAGEGVMRLNNSVLVLTERGPAAAEGSGDPGRPPAAPVVFVGDIVRAPGSVAHAIASGKEAAMALDLLLRKGPGAVRPGLKRCAVGSGRSLSFEAYMNGPRSRRSSRLVRYGDINTDYFQFSPRLTQPRLLKAERVRSFAEIDLKISASIAMREAERCFNCGICNQCDNCRLFCPDLAVVRDLGQPPASRVGGRAVEILDSAPPPRGRYIDYDYCKGCGICVVECPRNAMTLEEEASFHDSD
jgi:NADPH-dependent glutamate synthase beta subunit-like oxidoreductase